MGTPEARFEARLGEKRNRPNPTELGKIHERSAPLLPLLSNFTKGYRALLEAHSQDYASNKLIINDLYQREYDMSVLLFKKILPIFSFSPDPVPLDETADPTAILAAQLETHTPIKQTFYNLTICAPKLIRRAHEATLTNNILVSTSPLLKGSGSLSHIQTPNQISALAQAARARCSEGRERYQKALEMYATEVDLISMHIEGEQGLWKTLQVDLQSRRELGVDKHQFRRFGDNEQLNAVDFEVNCTFESISKDTYHPHIKNNLLVAPTILDEAIGGKVEDSILATCELDPFARAIDLHLINTYVVDGNGDIHPYKDSHVGLGTQNGASLIDWHNYPDFRKACELAA